MPWVVGRMGVVAGPAGAAFDLFVDMYEMQVLLAIAETGHGCRVLGVGKVFLMTLETKFVVLRIVGAVEDRREIGIQYPEIVRTMGIMTA